MKYQIQVKNMFGEFEDRKIETWEKLGKEFTGEQANWGKMRIKKIKLKKKKEMNRYGYSLMNKAQMELIYGPKSPFNNSEALQRLLPFIEGKRRNLSGINQVDIGKLFNY
jgi:hypothetical protein